MILLNFVLRHRRDQQHNGAATADQSGLWPLAKERSIELHLQLQLELQQLQFGAAAEAAT